MSLSENKITDNQIATNGVVSAPDKLTGTAAENKAVFDKLIRETVKSAVNGMIDDLISTTGATEIGASVPDIDGNNVQAILSGLKNYVDNSVVEAGAMTSFNGRNGQVVSEVGDYSADQIYGLFSSVWPVGSIYISTSETNPSEYFGGTWVSWGSGKVPIGVDALDEDYSEAEKTGGAKTVNLSHRHVQSVGVDGDNVYLKRNNAGDSIVKNVDRTLASHTSHATATGRFGYTDNAGSTTQSIVQPYITCYMWKRTA